MGRAKAPGREYVQVICEKPQRNKCRLCGHEFPGTGSRIAQHFSSNSNQVKSCTAELPADLLKEIKEWEDAAEDRKRLKEAQEVADDRATKRQSLDSSAQGSGSGSGAGGSLQGSGSGAMVAPEQRRTGLKVGELCYAWPPLPIWSVCEELCPKKASCCTENGKPGRWLHGAALLLVISAVQLLASFPLLIEWFTYCAQGPIGEAFVRGSHDMANKLLMELLAGDGLPLSLVRSERFKKCVLVATINHNDGAMMGPAVVVGTWQGAHCVPVVHPAHHTTPLPSLAAGL